MLLPAITLAFSKPPAGATKLILQLIAAPLANGLTVGLLGVQTVVAPLGNPVIAQVAAVPVLGPLLVQVIVPVTVCPAFTVVGSVLPVTVISACGTILVVTWVALLPGVGSAVLDPAVPVTVTVPLAGTV